MFLTNVYNKRNALAQTPILRFAGQTALADTPMSQAETVTLQRCNG